MEGLDFEVIEGRDDSHLPNPEGEGFGGYGLAKTADEEGEPEIRENLGFRNPSTEL